jgi:putative inorganic carbon (hco3(-)) transporter
VMLGIVIMCFAGSWNVIFGFSSLADRGDMWANGVKIFKEHPIIGNGINTFFNKYRYIRTDRDVGRGSYAHNCYLQMAADTGILGLLAFLWFVFSIIKKGADYIVNGKDKFYQAAVLGLVVGISAFLLHSAVDTNLYSLNLASLFWLSAGFLIAVIRVAEQKT